MQRTQRSYSIPDRTLRDSIKRDNKEFILPKYQAFYDSFDVTKLTGRLDGDFGNGVNACIEMLYTILDWTVTGMWPAV
mgnify:CR=1 FL=1